MSAWGTIVTATPVKSGPRLILLLLFALTALLMHTQWWSLYVAPSRWSLIGVICGSWTQRLFCRPVLHSLTQIFYSSQKQALVSCRRSAFVNTWSTSDGQTFTHSHTPGPHAVYMYACAVWGLLFDYTTHREDYALFSYFVAVWGR